MDYDEIDKMYAEECAEISAQCEEEGYPSHGSNYELRCESLGESCFQCYGYNPCTGKCAWDEEEEEEEK